jgi:cation diffusion facilitator CzcD-associated flavoprotein CzcO
VLTSIRIEGLEGRLLDQTWGGEPDAYRGLSVADFPNLFILLGPNTGQGHTSAILFIEAQVNYTLQCIQELSLREKRYLVIKPEAMERYNQELRNTLHTSVWAAGCRSWYKTESGKIHWHLSRLLISIYARAEKPRFDDYFIC